ncbi:MAG TPA: XF1762 family protein [Myxococcota bacterium]|nr:XF1762 family protein [Myxococcota bacterium]
MTRDEALAFIAQHHRHHGRPVSCLFSVGAALGETVVGVAIVGRPVSRMLDDGWTAELVRLCTDGTTNAPSFLVGRVRRALRVLGYRKLYTYTLPEESGASMRAAGWHCEGLAGGGSWSRESRPRVDKHPTQAKLRWALEVGS